jgi:hypothetical protein
MKTAASSSKQLREQRGNGGRMKKKSIVKRILGISVLALVSSWVVLVSAAPNVIDIEPEECQTRCYYIMGVPIICYEICF